MNLMQGLLHGLSGGVNAYNEQSNRDELLELKRLAMQQQQEQMRWQQQQQERAQNQDMANKVGMFKTLNPSRAAELTGGTGNREVSRVNSMPDASTQVEAYKTQSATEDKKRQQQSLAWYFNGGEKTDPGGQKFAAQMGYSPLEHIPDRVLTAADNRENQRQMQEERLAQALMLKSLVGGNGGNNWQPQLFTDKEGNSVWVKPGEPVPKGFGKGGGDDMKNMPQAAVSSISTNLGTLSRIQDALTANEAAPEATGMLKGLVNDFAPSVMNKIDPEGTDARAKLADVGSMIVHDRSGAAVTVSEYPRLRPFIPTAYDSPDEKKIKLENLYNAIQEETQLYASNYSPENGYARPSKWEGPLNEPVKSADKKQDQGSYRGKVDRGGVSPNAMDLINRYGGKR